MLLARKEASMCLGVTPIVVLGGLDKPSFKVPNRHT